MIKITVLALFSLLFTIYMLCLHFKRINILITIPEPPAGMSTVISAASSTGSTYTSHTPDMAPTSTHVYKVSNMLGLETWPQSRSRSAAMTSKQHYIATITIGLSCTVSKILRDILAKYVIANCSHPTSIYYSAECPV